VHGINTGSQDLIYNHESGIAVLMIVAMRQGWCRIAPSSNWHVCELITN
jgi:hypothetical protein